ncbi:hypothetical protein ACFUJR_06180 [Streptomyces sp. NPDC057271]|uniref:hypothetical protein n=1 Tax=unclassified Streptomyces TaxID=2593676 RepID=UPI003630B2D6
MAEAKNGYAEIDAGARRRMPAIQHDTQRHCDAERDPTAAVAAARQRPPSAQPGESSGAA